jgi:hypothetical protein
VTFVTIQIRIVSTSIISTLLCSCLSLVACTDDAGTEAGETGETGETGEPALLEIAGSYTDEYGDMHTITEDTWTNAAGSFAIAEFDNAAAYLLAQNAASNAYFPDLWSRFDWTWDADALYYCQSVFDGATIDDARAGSADAGDLMAGCGGFAWTRLE